MMSNRLLSLYMPSIFFTNSVLAKGRIGLSFATISQGQRNPFNKEELLKNLLERQYVQRLGSEFAADSQFISLLESLHNKKALPPLSCEIVLSMYVRENRYREAYRLFQNRNLREMFLDESQPGSILLLLKLLFINYKFINVLSVCESIHSMNFKQPIKSLAQTVSSFAVYSTSPANFANILHNNAELSVNGLRMYCIAASCLKCNEFDKSLELLSQMKSSNLSLFLCNIWLQAVLGKEDVFESMHAVSFLMKKYGKFPVSIDTLQKMSDLAKSIEDENMRRHFNRRIKWLSHRDWVLPKTLETLLFGGVVKFLNDGIAARVTIQQPADKIDKIEMFFSGTVTTTPFRY